MTEHRCDDVEDALLRAAAAGEDEAGLRARAGECPECTTLARDLAVVAPALATEVPPVPGEALVMQTNYSSRAVLRARRRRTIAAVAAVAAALLPLLVAWNAVVAWAGYHVLVWLLPAAVARTGAAVAVAAFVAATVAAGGTVYGGLPIATARLIGATSHRRSTR
jgi:hypothetical protein